MIAVGQCAIPAGIKDSAYADAMDRAREVARREMLSALVERDLVQYRVTPRPDGSVVVEAFTNATTIDI